MTTEAPVKAVSPPVRYFLTFKMILFQILAVVITSGKYNFITMFWHYVLSG